MTAVTLSGNYYGRSATGGLDELLVRPGARIPGPYRAEARDWPRKPPYHKGKWGTGGENTVEDAFRCYYKYAQGNRVHFS